jgi:hypothetical protein
VFPDEEGLYRYMVERGADFEDCVVVELEGHESDDEDFDADEGALLVIPTKVLGARPVDKDRLAHARPS